MKPFAALAAALLLACGASTSSGTSDDPSTPEPPGQPSSGCSQWTLARGVTSGSIQVGGLTRTYVLSVPAAASGELPVVFAFHGMGDNGRNFRGWFPGFEGSAKGPTIFVYPDALIASSGQSEWDDAGGRDVAFFDALLARIEGAACVDSARVFVTGFSYGAFMSNKLGCKRAGVVRAVAPLSGGGSYGSCNGQRVAAWLACGDQDSLLSSTTGARDHWVAVNHCTTTASAVSPSPCVAYSGCDGGYPVIWCPFTGTHQVQSWEPPALMRFFDGL
jgi:poly(3-hydroxybutyrate) depolymerase